MADFAATASFLWWIMLLASTAIILYDLAEKAFSKKPIDRIDLRRNRTSRETNVDVESIADSIQRSVEMSYAGFQKEAAQTILAAALAAKGSPLTRIQESRHEMLDLLISDSELKKFIRTYFIQNPRKIDRKNLKKELERTNLMLTTAERLFR